MSGGAGVVSLADVRARGAAAGLAACRAVLSADGSPMGLIWDAQAGDRDRRLMLVMAGESSETARRLAARPWREQSPERRAAILAAMRRWREWAGRLA